MSRPLTPERFSSLLSVPKQRELDFVRKRKVSTASQLSIASSTSEFIETKLVNVKTAIEYGETLKSYLKEALDDGNLSETQYREALEEIDSKDMPRRREIMVLKRQKKIIQEDLDEEAPQYSNLEDAYTSIIVNKVMEASGKQKKQKFKSSEFKTRVLEYYGASKMDDDGVEQLSYCHLSGWHAAPDVKAAHIVPKSLQSEEVSYLFGVGEAILADPKNSITLERKIEVALDTGLIVFVPVPTEGDEETKWKCVLTDKSKSGNIATSPFKWRELDGRELVFLGPNRPARRFLYFRFIITYLQAKRDGNIGWISEIEAKGRMWALPGPYLRQSMLITLARKISDLYLPETFYEHTTFREVESCAARNVREEDELASSLAVKLEYKQNMERWRNNESEDDDDEEK